MSRHRLILVKILKILEERPSTPPEICKITKKSRKVIRQNLITGQRENLINKDIAGRYHLTPLGISMINSADLPLDCAEFRVNSDVVYARDYMIDEPTAKCTIYIKNPKKMLELDKDTDELQTALLHGGGYGTWENTTNLQASAGLVVSAVLDLKAKEMGLFSKLSSEYAENVDLFNFKQMPGGYDNLKRFQGLAKTKFVFMIEFDGEKWVQNQNLEDLEKRQELGWKSAKESIEEWQSRDTEAKINLIIGLIGKPLNKKTLEASGLFESEKELKDYLYRLFREFKVGRTDNEQKQKLRVAFSSGLFKCSKRTIYHASVNDEKLNEFLS